MGILEVLKNDANMVYILFFYRLLFEQTALNIKVIQCVYIKNQGPILLKKNT